MNEVAENTAVDEGLEQELDQGLNQMSQLASLAPVHRVPQPAIVG